LQRIHSPESPSLEEVAMTTPAVPAVECERHHPSLAVRDVSAAVGFYTTRLGFAPGFTWGEPPRIAGVNLGSVQIFLQEGTPCPGGGEVFFVVGDADELYGFHRAGGVEVVEELDDREYGIRDYTVRDPDGNRLCFGHPIFTVGPPVEIERVEVTVRLEKRLAALLHDLAAHKRMSLTGCLEEILLHTCEPFGDGVASPHTRRDLAVIQELKAKHGIDYDTHAGYRFVER
jgi:catechol 2,3-dioxygenase-like lactoylglutathione lyase family enzyme